jgi:hypothetical protein
MFYIINESDKINVSLTTYSGAEERFPTSKQRLANQNTDEDYFSIFAEPPVMFDEETDAAYKVWQESLAYLQEHTETMP